VESEFPQTARHSQHTPETVLERIVAPAGAAVLRVSRLIRRLQHGRVQSYVLYILIGLVLLAAWLWLADRPGAAPL
jgi:hydrogenase-4 component B